jgi:hypothetical protein
MQGIDLKRTESKRALSRLNDLKKSNSNVIEMFRIGSMITTIGLKIPRFTQSGLIVLVFLSGLLAATSSAQKLPQTEEEQGAPPVMIRSSLSPESGIYVGQKVRLFVEVLTNTWFTKAPQFPELRIPNAICLELSQFGVNFTERIEGETYAAQRKEYVIYPQRPESYSVPSLTVDIAYARPGEPHGEVTLDSPPQQFKARVPEEAKSLDYFVTTPQLRVQEEYDRSFEDLKVGDSLSRTVTMIADDSVGMLLPPLDFGVIEGLSTYPASPRMEDESNRGVYTGKRFESVTYVMEKEGDFTFPEINIYWYDLTNEKLKTEVLPRLKFSVATNPELEQEMLAFLEDEEKKLEEEGAATKRRPLDVKNILYIILALSLLVAALVIFIIPYIKRLKIWWKRRRAIKAESEKAYFKRFRRSCNKGDSKETMQSLMNWLDKVYPGPGAATIEDFARRSGDLELQIVTAGLKSELYGKSDIDESQSMWSGQDFYKIVSQARIQLIQKEKIRTKPSGLQPLNP